MNNRLRLSINSMEVKLGDPTEICQLPTVLEDRSYPVEVICPLDWGQPVAYIEDYLLEEPEQKETSGGTAVWEWRSDAYFRNCFGLTRFRLEFPDGRTILSHHFEVVSRKVSSSDIMTMIRYLQTRAERVIEVGFSKTRLGLALGGSMATIDHTLQVAEEAVQAIEDLLVIRSSRVRRRLVEERLVKDYELKDPVDDRSITYILENLDRGVRQPKLGKHFLPVDMVGHRLYFSELDVVSKQECSDVYENRIIHGFLKSMLQRMGEISAYLEAVYDEVDRHHLKRSWDFNEDYTSFVSLCGYLVGRLSRHTLDRINRLLERVRINEWRAQQLIPAKAVSEMPRNTPWFSVYPRYRRIFVSARKWYMIRDQFADLSYLLLRLRTFDRLYEYVCLFQLLELFEAEGWQLYDASMVGYSGALRGELNNRYLFRSALGELELLYEPRIPSYTSGELPWNRAKIVGDRRRSFSPDFVVRIYHMPSGKESYIVLDAKYGSDRSITDYHLPQVVLKYNYGVANLDDLSRPPFNHIWILAPVQHFRNYQWHLPRAGFQRTSVGVVGVLPETARVHLRAWYRDVVLKAMLEE